MILSRMSLFGCVILCSTAVSPVFGGPINWTTWTAATTTSATGTLTVGTTPVSVSYSGEVASTRELNGVGTNFFLPLTTFSVSPLVPNAPPGGNMIAIDGTATAHTIAFGRAVVDPIMDIVSLGQPGVATQYIFSLATGQSMSILARGPSNAFGGCSTTACLSLAGSTLTGHEGDGVIQFTGTYTSLTWTGANPEFWNGFTFGVTGLPTTGGVPEPATWGTLLIASIAGVPLALRRRKNR